MDDVGPTMLLFFTEHHKLRASQVNQLTILDYWVVSVQTQLLYAFESANH